MIELHLIGYTADLEHLVLDLESSGGGRYRLIVDGDLFATLDDLREQRWAEGMDVGLWEPTEWVEIDEHGNEIESATSEPAHVQLDAAPVDDVTDVTAPALTADEPPSPGAEPAPPAHDDDVDDDLLSDVVMDDVVMGDAEFLDETPPSESSDRPAPVHVVDAADDDATDDAPRDTTTASQAPVHEHRDGVLPRLSEESAPAPAARPADRADGRGRSASDEADPGQEWSGHPRVRLVNGAAVARESAVESVLEHESPEQALLDPDPEAELDSLISHVASTNREAPARPPAPAPAPDDVDLSRGTDTDTGRTSDDGPVQQDRVDTSPPDPDGARDDDSVAVEDRTRRDTHADDVAASGARRAERPRSANRSSSRPAGAAAARPERPRTAGGVAVPDEAQLSPKQIQGLLRSGKSVKQVAKAAATDEEWIRRWLEPIQAEQERVVAEARDLALTLDGESCEVPLGTAVDHHLARLGAERISWSATRRDDRPWRISVRYTDGGRSRTASWALDRTGRTLRPASTAARELGWLESTSSRR